MATGILSQGTSNHDFIFHQQIEDWKKYLRLKCKHAAVATIDEE